MYIAHIDEYGKKQSVQEHNRNVAQLAEQKVERIGLGKLAYLTGYLHDIGKYSTRFQKYITAQEGTKGSVIHSTAGLRYIFDAVERLHPTQKWLAELVGFSVASHHGLMDCIFLDGTNGFYEKIRNDDRQGDYEEVKERFEEDAFAAIDFDGVLAEAMREVSEKTYGNSFGRGLLARLLLSAVIDADRRDTANFYFGEKKEEIDSRSVFESMANEWEKRIAELEKKARPSLINDVRKYISRSCFESAQKEEGVYRLSVPTGSGKTLSSLRFALWHSIRKDKKKIFYIAPLLTILEQNTAEILAGVGVENGKYVLEHTSDIVASAMSDEDSARYESLAEDWSAPIVVTTMVQFLNTLFDGKTSCIRRMQALVNSVIIIDEVQSIPIKLTKMFCASIRFLTNVCRCTVVICSATQPIAKLPQNIQIKVPSMKELVTLSSEQEKVFERVKIFNETDTPCTLEDLAEKLRENQKKSTGTLCICNTKKEAAKLFDMLSMAFRGEKTSVYHLSAGMCKAHRTKVLEDVRKKLSENESVLCVSTQVIEAGVDISFSCVYRVLAGLDSIMQSAGRCNRHGERESGDVHIIRLQNEKITALREIEKAQEAAKQTFAGQKDIVSKDGISFYYHRLYQIYPAKDLEFSVLNNTLYDLLGIRTGFASADVTFKQAFKTAGEMFSVFDEETISVIVPYDETAKQLIIDLCGKEAERNYLFTQKKLEAVKPYIVSLYKPQQRVLEQNGGLYARSICGQNVLFLQEDFYSETGVTDENNKLKGGF